MKLKVPQIKKDIFYVGANDRKKQLFENIWPIETGVSYNSYLIVDKKTALIDTVDLNVIDTFLSKVEHSLQGRQLDYLVINHMEPDHCSGIRYIMRLYPQVQLVGNKKTFDILANFFGTYTNLIEVQEGDTLTLGQRTLKFYFAPMVHWPEVMMSFETSEHILFSADAFGSFGTLDGGITDEELDFNWFTEEYVRYYANVVGKFAHPVQQILKKFNGITISTIAPTHGPVITHHINIEKLLSLYHKLSSYETEQGVVIAYASMYGNTEAIAEVIARELAENGIKHIKVFDVSKTHASYILRDIFKYKGLILGSPTYNMELHPSMEALVMKLEHLGLKKRVYASFGTFSWAGKAAKKLGELGEHLQFDIAAPTIEEKGALKDEKFAECIVMAQIMAEKLKQYL